MSQINIPSAPISNNNAGNLHDSAAHDSDPGANQANQGCHGADTPYSPVHIDAIEPPSAQAGAADSDHFDLDKFRLPQNFDVAAGVKQHLMSVPVRRPDRHTFIRVHPDPAYRLSTAILEFKEERELFLVDQSLYEILSGELVPKVLYTAITRSGVVFIWPIRLPGEDGRLDEWNRTALAAAQMGIKSWVRIAANQALGAYEVHEAICNPPEPKWPEEDFRTIMNIAFRDRYINDISHPAIRRLRGEA